MYKSIKKSIKFVCNECGAFFPTSREYCEECGSSDIRKATRKDLSRYAKTHNIEKTSDFERNVANCQCFIIIIVLLIIVIATIGYFLLTWDI